MIILAITVKELIFVLMYYSWILTFVNFSLDDFQNMKKISKYYECAVLGMARKSGLFQYLSQKAIKFYLQTRLIN